MSYTFKTETVSMEEICELLNEIKKECFKFKVCIKDIYTMDVVTFSFSEKGAKHPWDPFDFSKTCSDVLKNQTGELVGEISYCFNKDEEKWLIIEIDSDGKELYISAYIKVLIHYFTEDYSKRTMSVSESVSSILSEDCPIKLSQNIILSLLRYPYLFSVP